MVYHPWAGKDLTLKIDERDQTNQEGLNMVRLRYFQSLTWVTGGTEFIPYVNCRK